MPKLDVKTMVQSNMIDHIVLLGAIEEIKRALQPKNNNYNVLLYDNLYLIIDYKLMINTEYPKTFQLYTNSDFVFKLEGCNVNILKNRISFDKARAIFEKRSISVLPDRHISLIDEE